LLPANNYPVNIENRKWIMTSSLIHGKKEELLGEFNRLKLLHGKQWRSLLRACNKWHDSSEGLYAWQNASRGTVGNETLRKIISDMQKIEAKGRKAERSLSPKKLESIRQETVDQSLKSLRHGKVRAKKIA
jgi:hypothetical protein